MFELWYLSHGHLERSWMISGLRSRLIEASLGKTLNPKLLSVRMLNVYRSLCGSLRHQRMNECLCWEALWVVTKNTRDRSYIFSATKKKKNNNKSSWHGEEALEVCCSIYRQSLGVSTLQRAVSECSHLWPHTLLSFLHLGTISPFRFHSSVSPSLQCRLPGATQGDASALCHEKDQQAESDPEEPDPAGVRGEGHPHLRGESVCRLHVLLLWDAETSVHGHGICRGWGNPTRFDCTLCFMIHETALEAAILFFCLPFPFSVAGVWGNVRLGLCRSHFIYLEKKVSWSPEPPLIILSAHIQEKCKSCDGDETRISLLQWFSTMKVEQGQPFQNIEAVLGNGSFLTLRHDG